MPRNEIADLYVTGEQFTLRHGPRNVKVWLQKLNDVEHIKAVRKAGAAQARVSSTLRDTDSDEYLSLEARAQDLGRPELVSRLLQPSRQRALLANEARLAEEEEWADEDYLEGLRSAWQDGLQKRYVDALEAKSDQDPDVVRVFDELNRFGKQVAEAVEQDLAVEQARLEAAHLDDLIDEFLPMLVKDAGVEAWLDEFRRCEVWLGTRRCTHAEHSPDEPSVNHRDLYFETRAEVDVIQTVAFGQLSLAMQSLTVAPLEGKDSEETPASSNSSESPEEQGTEVSSGLVGAQA